MVGLSFSDLDEDMQRSVFAAITILALLLAVSLFKWVHYAFIAITALASLYMAYMLFIKPKLKHKKVVGK